MEASLPPEKKVVFPIQEEAKTNQVWDVIFLRRLSMFVLICLFFCFYILVDFGYEADDPFLRRKYHSYHF